MHSSIERVCALAFNFNTKELENDMSIAMYEHFTYAVFDSGLAEPH